MFVIICTGSLISCSSPDNSTTFNLESAKKRWNTAEKSWTPDELKSLEQGRVTYKNNCAACHGKEGDGNLTIGAPALVNNAIIKGDISYHMALIKNGKAVMPAFDKTLNDAEIYNVAAYERNAWGNHDYQVYKNNPD